MKNQLQHWSSKDWEAAVTRLIECGNVNALKKFLDNGISFPMFQISPLGIAVEANQLAMVWYLVQTVGLSLKTTVNRQNETCLHIAARFGYQNMIVELAPYIDMNTVNFEGNTVMDVACAANQVHVVKYLLKKYPRQNVVKLTHLQCAIERKFVHLFDTLLEYAQELLRTDTTMLPLAVALENKIACLGLIKHGANATGVNANGYTLWQMTLMQGWSDGIDIFITPDIHSWATFAVEHSPPTMIKALCQKNSCIASSLRNAAQLAGKILLVKAMENESLSPGKACGTNADSKELFTTDKSDKWGTVLRYNISNANASQVEQFYREFTRSQRSQKMQTNTLVRFLGVDDAAALFEPPGISWSAAFQHPFTEEMVRTFSQEWCQLQFICDIVQALLCLHQQDIAHGAIHPDFCFINPQMHSGKLHVVPAQSASIYSAPESRSDAGYDAQAADVYSLGAVLDAIAGFYMPYEAKALVQQMKSMSPIQRPRMPQVAEHPCFWDKRKKLQYIQAVASYDANHPRVLACRQIHLPYKWQDLLPPALVTQQHRKYNNTTFALVRWIRNFKEHGRDHLPTMWQTLQEMSGMTKNADMSTLECQEECLGLLVTKFFPTLVLSLWQVLGRVD